MVLARRVNQVHFHLTECYSVCGSFGGLLSRLLKLLPLLEESHRYFSVSEGLTDAWPLLVDQIEILLTECRNGRLYTWTRLTRVKQLSAVIQRLVTDLGIQQTKVTHFLRQVIPNNALTLNKTKDARLDTLIALSL